MIGHRIRRRGLMLAGAFAGVLAGAMAGVLALVAAATAQQPAPLAPGSPLFGRPNNANAAKLAPIPPPPLPATAAELTGVLAKLKLPKGFYIEVYAGGVANARSLRQGNKGTVFAGSRLLDKVYAITDRNGKRETRTLLSGLYRPNGLAFHDGTLYIAELSKISKVDDVEAHLDDPKLDAVYDDLPKDEAHGWKFIGIGPDNKLYVPVGQPCNNCVPDDKHGHIRSMNLDGTGVEVIARGVRNSVGFDWHPLTRQLYFTDSGRDWLSEDMPEDELNRVTRAGEHFGSPYCYQGDIPDSEFGWGHSCDEFTPPVARMGPHAGAHGMRFYTGQMFPREYRNAVFVARHGSWSRTRKFGGDIAVVMLNKDGSVKSVAPFLTGFIQDNGYIGRPVDVLVAGDGSLLVSDDWNGAIYRVGYGKQPRTAAAQ